MSDALNWYFVTYPLRLEMKRTPTKVGLNSNKTYKTRKAVTKQHAIAESAKLEPTVKRISVKMHNSAFVMR